MHIHNGSFGWTNTLMCAEQYNSIGKCGWGPWIRSTASKNWRTNTRSPIYC